MDSLDVKDITQCFIKWLDQQSKARPLLFDEDLEVLLCEYLAIMKVRDIEEYIGNLKAISDGLVYQALTDEAVKLGAKPKVGSRSRVSDILERYRTISLHAIFLYTSEDDSVADYVLNNWGALDTLSGDFCDIHPIIDQFNGITDAYDYIDNLDIIREAKFDDYSNLPGIFFWDNQGKAEYIPLKINENHLDIRNIVRYIFTEIRKDPTITSITRGKRNLRSYSPDNLGDSVMPEYATKRILILAANPIDTSSLRLAEELREIDEALRRAKLRDRFILEQKLAVRIRDLRRAMLDVNPDIVHFSGHGIEGGLILENQEGKSQLVEAAALSGLFKLFENQLRCVILNACYSASQAEAISQHIDYVIGMQQPIGDKAAIEFSLGFYDALYAGRSFPDAFDFGCNAIRLEGLATNTNPVIHMKTAQ